MIDTSAALAEGLKSVLGAAAPVRLVATTDDALKALEAEEVALIVADLSVGQDGLVTLFKLLKSQHPEILVDPGHRGVRLGAGRSSSSTRRRSSGSSTSPSSVRQLRGHVEAALAKYRAFKQRPDLVRGQMAVESVQAKTSLWGAKLFERIRSLPDRLFSAPRKGVSPGSVVGRDRALFK